MRLAVIGTGRWGSKILETLDRLSIPYDACNTTGEYKGKPCYDNWVTLLNTKPDGVIIAANPALNLPIMQHAELLNIPVMAEKPAAFYLADVYKMEKLKIPILINYIHLFNPHYQAMKAQIKSPIVRIGSLGYGFGPFRHFSGLFDYAPHDLSMAMDLIPDKFNLVNCRAKENRQTGGRLYHLDFKTQQADVHIVTGNGGNEKVRKLAVFCQDGNSYIYEDKPSTAPLENAIKHFLQVIGGAKPKPSFDLTVRIHTALYECGNHWEKEKKHDRARY